LVLLFFLHVTAFSNSFIDQSINEGRQLTFSVLSAEGNAGSAASRMKGKNEFALLPFHREVINLTNREGGSLLLNPVPGRLHMQLPSMSALKFLSKYVPS